MTPAITALLVPLDGSKGAERAIEPARRLARLSGTPVTLFHWDFDDREGALTGSYLEMLAAGLDVPATVEVVVNEDLPGSIVAAAAEHGAVICMATQGRSGVPRAILGSVAEEVLRRVATPTVLVGPHVEPVVADDVGTIVACVDGSHLSEEALAPVARWAQQLGAPIELVHAIDPAMDAEPSDVNIDVVDAGYLSRLTRSMSSARRPDFEVLHGSAVNAIVDHVHEGVELVAMATHGRTGLARMALGSVALGVTHRARRPVLAVPSVAAVA